MTEVFESVKKSVVVTQEERKVESTGTKGWMEKKSFTIQTKQITIYTQKKNRDYQLADVLTRYGRISGDTCTNTKRNGDYCLTLHKWTWKRKKKKKNRISQGDARDYLEFVDIGGGGAACSCLCKTSSAHNGSGGKRPIIARNISSLQTHQSKWN